jgi:Carbohydrate-selective porin, OprB family/S-layer homology domain
MTDLGLIAVSLLQTTHPVGLLEASAPQELSQSAVTIKQRASDHAIATPEPHPSSPEFIPPASRPVAPEVVPEVAPEVAPEVMNPPTALASVPEIMPVVPRSGTPMTGAIARTPIPDQSAPSVVKVSMQRESLHQPLTECVASPAENRPADPLDDPSDDAMTQVTSVSQLTDVRPTDWAFQALQSLVERYGCIAGYPDKTFRGNRALTRYEFAAGLNACLDRINELITSATADVVKQDDLATLQKLQEEFAAELATLRGRVDQLEARTATLERQQFSTTTRLFGQAIFSIQGSNRTNVDLFPRDGVPEREGKLQTTLANQVELSLATSFRPGDLLLTGFQTGNLRSSAPDLLTTMGRLAYESEQDQRLALSDLSYRFPVSQNFGVIVGAAGVNPSNTFRGINPLEGSGDGALSRLGQRNPILAIGNGTGGIGFDWQISPRVSLQGIYSAELPAVASNSNFGGLFGGRYVAGAQLALAPTNSIDVGINYLFSRSPDGSLGTGIGDSQLISPFTVVPVAIKTHAVGATVAWRINPGWTVGGWGGWTTSTPVDGGISGSVQTTNWMAFSTFPDLFGRGNLGGILVGQPPKITASSLPDGFNFPKFATDSSAGGQSDTAIHLEMFYRARITENISITPGILTVFNPNHNAANDTLVIGTVRTTFRF